MDPKTSGKIKLDIYIQDNDGVLIPLKLSFEDQQATLYFEQSFAHPLAERAYETLETLAEKLNAQGINCEAYRCQTEGDKRVDCVKIQLTSASHSTVLSESTDKTR